MRADTGSIGAACARWVSLVGALVLGSVAGAAGATPGVSAEAAPVATDVRQLVFAVLRAHDHRGRPFAVVDKKHAVLYVFGPSGSLVGRSAVLVGQARGDRSWPGVGNKPPAALRPHERTTPAGRFESEPGVNLDGEDVVWFDYEAALALHRVRSGPALHRRLQALATPEPHDNRLSLGCVVVPVGFYDRVVRPLLGRARATVYVLPEDGRPDALLQAIAL